VRPLLLTLALLLAACGPSSTSKSPAAPASASDASSASDAPGAAAPPAASETPTTKPAPGSVRTIDVPTLHAERDSVAFLLDVRTPREFDRAHVPGAVNIPLDQLEARVDELAPHRDGPIHVICQSGGRSRRAAGQLAAAGFDVVDVQGGTGGWMAAGYTIE